MQSDLGLHCLYLTLVILNKLRCHPTSNFQPVRLLDLDLKDCWMSGKQVGTYAASDLGLHCLLRHVSPNM